MPLGRKMPEAAANTGCARPRSMRTALSITRVDPCTFQDRSEITRGYHKRPSAFPASLVVPQMP